MIHRLRPIDDQTPVSFFLQKHDASRYSMISRGKPVLKGEGYFATFAEVECGEVSYYYGADISNWESIAARLASSRASLLILNSELSLFVRPQMNQALLFCAQPKKLFADLVSRSIETVSSDPLTALDTTCKVGRHTTIESGAVLGKNVMVGDNCTIHGNVTIGDNVVIKSGAIIGGSGFEFYKDDQGHSCHFPHTGRVVIENDVYIGSNVVIDTAVFKETVIRRGTKIDNLASIAHNVEIGEDCLIMANTSIAGSVKIGPRSRICLAASIRDGVRVGSDCVIGMNACVTSDIPDGVTAYGVPAKPINRSIKPNRKRECGLREDSARTLRLIRETVKRLQLDLTGYTVVTEAATGHFAATAPIAALAGANVQAIAADSPYGLASDASRATLALATGLGVDSHIEIVSRDEADFANANIVTNLGFVRPIDRKVASVLRSGTVISVMYDARELRPSEIDLDQCRERGVHVVGTCEEHPHAHILKYCGPLAVRLLMEQDIEIQGAHIALAGENFFTAPIVTALERLGAEVTVLTAWSQLSSNLVESLDALVYLDYWNQLGDISSVRESLENLEAHGSALIQFIGGLDIAPFKDAHWRLIPETPIQPHRMWRTLAYLGPKPVIELHAAGLKAAELELRDVPPDSGGQFDGLRQPIVAFRAAEIIVTP